MFRNHFSLTQEQSTRCYPTLILLAVISSLFVVHSVYADDPAPPQYITSWVLASDHWPTNVAVGANGTVYVVDRDKHAILSYDANGNLLGEWGVQGSAEGEFNMPSDLAVDNLGNIYIADMGNHRIQKLDAEGHFVTQWGSQGTAEGQFAYPSGITIGSSNQVYVADTYNQRIQKFDADGNFLAMWKIQLPDNTFVKPLMGDIAVDSNGNSYVTIYSALGQTHFLDFHIQKFDAEGNFVTRWGEYGSADGKFFSPYGIAIDSHNAIYVSENGNRIQKFDTDGNFITAWGSYGSAEGQFYSPYGLAVDNHDAIYVADKYNHRIQQFAYAAVAVPPAAPQELHAKADSSNQVSLHWTDTADNESGFKIERCQNKGCSNFVEIATVAADVTDYQDTGLQANMRYRYRVRAYNDAGNSPYSNKANITTPPAPPNAPSDLKATVITKKQIRLTWTDNSDNEKRFRIERCQGVDCTNFAGITNVKANVNSFSDNSVRRNTTYRYRVMAANEVASSAPSNVISATTLAQ